MMSDSICIEEINQLGIQRSTDLTDGHWLAVRWRIFDMDTSVVLSEMERTARHVIQTTARYIQ
jgi:hypothetical protein